MDFRLPELGEGIYEAELNDWRVKVGDVVKRGQGLLEVLTDKATMEVPAPFAGTITSLHAEAGRQVKVGDLMLTYDPGEERETPTAQRAARSTQRAKAQAEAESDPRALAHPSPAQRMEAGPTPLSIKAAPSVRQLARKLGVDLSRVAGSGPGGRILIEDLPAREQPDGAVEKQAPAAPRPEFGTPGSRIRLLGLRRKIAEHLVHAKHTAPHYSYVEECEVTELVRLRTGLRDTFARSGVKLTYLPFFVKAVTAALKEVPIVNASLDDAAGEIQLHDRYHIGIATATPNGLLVPVVRDAERKSLAEIARDIECLSGAVRAGKARAEELRGSTFTITSVGGIGGLFSTPVINHPEVAILGIGRIIKRPVYDDGGNIRPADLVYLSLSFDHRVVDGAVGAAFCNAIIRRLRNPAVLLLPENLL